MLKDADGYEDINKNNHRESYKSYKICVKKNLTQYPPRTQIPTINAKITPTKPPTEKSASKKDPNRRCAETPHNFKILHFPSL